MKKLEYELVEPVILGYSQKGQESLISYTFDLIGTTNKYYVELGAMDGYHLSNTAYLRENDGWNGLLLEGNTDTQENDSINLRIRRITKDNVCDLFKEFDCPIEPDFVSIDLDGMDYWITEAMLKEYRPRFIMVETNVRFEPEESYTLKYNENWNWDGRKWYGASPKAFAKMFDKYGYAPVWITVDDMIVIRKDVLQEVGIEEPTWEYVYPSSNFNLYNGHDGGNPFGPIIYLDTKEWQEV